jgi:hypothetical protein
MEPATETLSGYKADDECLSSNPSTIRRRSCSLQSPTRHEYRTSLQKQAKRLTIPTRHTSSDLGNDEIGTTALKNKDAQEQNTSNQALENTERSLSSSIDHQATEILASRDQPAINNAKTNEPQRVRNDLQAHNTWLDLLAIATQASISLPDATAPSTSSAPAIVTD